MSRTEESASDYLAGWAHGYRRGFDAALRQVSSEVYARLSAPMNVPQLDAQDDFKRYALRRDTHA